MTRLLFIIFLLLIGQAFFIISKENIDIGNQIGKDRLVSIYLAWFGANYDRFFEISGQVIHSDWFSYNLTNLTSS